MKRLRGESAFRTAIRVHRGSPFSETHTAARGTSGNSEQSTFTLSRL